MLYALRDPLSFLGLTVGFVLGVLIRGVTQAAVARALGDRSFDLRARTRPDVRAHVDPFGAVAAALSGLGWGRSAPLGIDARARYGRLRGRGLVRLALVLVSGPAAVAVAGGACLALYRAVGGPRAFLAIDPSDVLHDTSNVLTLLDAGPRFVLCVAVALLAVALLALVPVAPLDGGWFLLAVAPATLTWQRIRHWADQNYGVGLLLVLLLLPVSSEGSLLLVLFNAVAGPILSLAQ